MCQERNVMSPSARTDNPKQPARPVPGQALGVGLAVRERSGARRGRRGARPSRARPPGRGGSAHRPSRVPGRRAGAALRASRSGWESGQVTAAASSPSQFSRQPGREGRREELRARAATPCSPARRALRLRFPQGEWGRWARRLGPNFYGARRRDGGKRETPRQGVGSSLMEELGCCTRRLGFGCRRLGERA